jgi:hypothetical protein
MANLDDVVEKTEAGLHEVKTRARGLAPRVRSLLIMIDGRHSVAQLSSAAAQIGAPEDFLQQLLEQRLVSVRAAVSRARKESSSGASAFGPSAFSPSGFDPSGFNASGFGPSAFDPSSFAPSSLTSDGPPPGASSLPADDFERFRAAQKLMNDTVADVVGVRAVFFALKLERCSNRNDLLALLPECRRLLEKVLKGSGALVEAQVRTLLL